MHRVNVGSSSCTVAATITGTQVLHIVTSNPHHNPERWHPHVTDKAKDSTKARKGTQICICVCPIPKSRTPSATLRKPTARMVPGLVLPQGRGPAPLPGSASCLAFCPQPLHCGWSALSTAPARLKLSRPPQPPSSGKPIHTFFPSKKHF